MVLMLAMSTATDTVHSDFEGENRPPAAPFSEVMGPTGSVHPFPMGFLAQFILPGSPGMLVTAPLFVEVVKIVLGLVSWTVRETASLMLEYLDGCVKAL